MSYYMGNQTGHSASLGLLPFPPYYWWESGAMWGTMIDYWYYTKDTSYNDVIAQGILSQASPTNDFMMPNQHYDLVSATLSPLLYSPYLDYSPNLSEQGNDDQVFWALSAMSAAEYSLPNPSTPSWLTLTSGVFNDQVGRWNTSTCAGGLKWQIFPENAGYDYKSSITNGGFLQLSARLARYTGNTTYSDWAVKTWDWMSRIGLISDNYDVYDGTDDKINCTGIDHTMWSYNVAALISGAATMANISAGDDTVWADRTAGILASAKRTFFQGTGNATNVMYESACEGISTCNNDQFSFKAYLARWLYAAAKMQPALQDQILDLMVPSAKAAAASCSSGTSGTACGTNWWWQDWGYATGVGQEMSALAAVSGLLVETVEPPGVELKNA